jgi:N utilization substance protein B
MIGGRRRARVLALKALYEVDSVGHDVDKTFDHLLAEEALSGENASFARELVNGVIQNKGEIDRKIQTFAPAWPIEQISVVDRNILRLAVFEILVENKVPVKAAINEAVELAKAFAGDSSPKFINGVLGSVSTLANR